MSERQKIIMTVDSGVVDVQDMPEGIDIVVRDYDVEGDWDPDNESCKIDEDGDRYQEIIFSN